MKIDSHTHIPPKMLDLALHSGIANGLGGIIITDYSGVAPFEALQTNRHDRTPVLHHQHWDIKKTNDPRVLRVDHARDGVQGTIYVGKGQEVESEKGHILALGIEKAIPAGMSWDKTLDAIYEQKGIAVFAHLFGKHSGGCGQKVFEEAWKRYSGRALGLEENAQYWNSNTNFQANQLATRLGAPLLFNSDIHGAYSISMFGRPYVQANLFGKKLYSFFPGVFGSSLFDGMKEVMINRPSSIGRGGEYNATMETVSWWVDSIRKNGWKKISGTLKHALKGFKK
jgi:hypothetical protein